MKETLSLAPSCEPSYSERQRFRQWWLWFLILIGPAFLLWELSRRIGRDEPVIGDSIETHVVTILLIIIGVIFPLFAYNTGLDTEVRASGIFIRFSPFHRKWISFPFHTIYKAEPITYSPLREYGGWGIRYGKNGKAYTVSGSKGILLTLVGERQVLIGSTNYKALWVAINRQGHPKNATP